MSIFSQEAIKQPISPEVRQLRLSRLRAVAFTATQTCAILENTSPLLGLPLKDTPVESVATVPYVPEAPTLLETTVQPIGEQTLRAGLYDLSAQRANIEQIHNEQNIQSN